MVYISDCLVKMQKDSYTLEYPKLKMAITLRLILSKLIFYYILFIKCQWTTANENNG